MLIKQRVGACFGVPARNILNVINCHCDASADNFEMQPGVHSIRRSDLETEKAIGFHVASGCFRARQHSGRRHRGAVDRFLFLHGDTRER